MGNKHNDSPPLKYHMPDYNKHWQIDCRTNPTIDPTICPAMVDLPNDDDGSWDIPAVYEPALPASEPKRKAKGKPKSTKRKGTQRFAAQEHGNTGAEIDLPEDDDTGCDDLFGVDLGQSELPSSSSQGIGVEETVQCDDSTLKTAAAAIPSQVKNPFPDLEIMTSQSCTSDAEMRCHLWEIFSVPRCSTWIRDLGGRARRSYDIKHFWDLGQVSFQRITMLDMLILRPLFVVLSPPCTYLRQLQHSNWKRIKKGNKYLNLEQALLFIDFCMWLAALQIALKHFFIFEHPAGSLAWDRASVSCLQTQSQNKPSESFVWDLKPWVEALKFVQYGVVGGNPGNLGSPYIKTCWC